MKRFRYSHKNWIDYLLIIIIFILLSIAILCAFNKNILFIWFLIINVAPIYIYIYRKYTGLFIYKGKIIVNVGYYKRIINISNIKCISVIKIKNECKDKKTFLYYISRFIDYINPDYLLDIGCNTFHNGEKYEIKIELKDETNYVVPYYWLYKEKNMEIVIKKRQELEEFIFFLNNKIDFRK